MKKFELKRWEYDDNYNADVLDIWYQNDKVCAYVQGSEIYKVELIIRNGRVDNYFCSCPACDGGMSFCKHLDGVVNYLRKWEIPMLEGEQKEESLNFDLTVKEIVNNFKMGMATFRDNGCVNCYQSEFLADFVFKYCIYIDWFLDDKKALEAWELTTAFIDSISSVYIYAVDTFDDIREILINYLLTLATSFDYYDNIREYLLEKYSKKNLDEFGKDILNMIVPTIEKREVASKYTSLLKQIRFESYQEDLKKECLDLLKQVK